MNEEYIQSEMFCMGTIITQRIYGENGKEVMLEVEREMRALEKAMNFYDTSSEIGVLNECGFEKEIELSKEVYDVIRSAKYFSEISSGAFDICLAPIIKLWGVFSDKEKIPSRREIDTALRLVNCRDLILDDKSRTVRLSKKNMMVDLGGIAKGFAADKAIEIYKTRDIKAAFINLGGNVAVFGKRPEGDAWCIGIQNPLKERGEIIAALNINNKSVVTSGNYVRYFQKNNIKYHHIMDGRTGYPARSSLLSVTVIAENSMLCDALSTAAFVLGINRGIELIKRFIDVDAIFVTEDKKIKVTQNITENFYLIDRNKFSYI
ncbi:FAD:protein FMN transferase [Clostridium felsineum]|uniref:FAD:protein FMN transferase n=1 Tax=Clostridium felsineum TaxID=36839 RepID=UPI00098C264A|nr:FAD:protein FMN transferase [Clostridium felsineum]URZ15173.1 FAD:protein FMN transferase [Clostridium felsineum DSM 794]